MKRILFCYDRRPMQLSQFQYHLPETLIAQYPLAQRDASRLLHLDAVGALHGRGFSELPELLKPGDLLVLNDTAVIPARLYGQKESGGKIEFLLERVTAADRAVGQLRSSKPSRAGMTLRFGSPAESVTAVIESKREQLFELRFSRPLDDWIETQGQVPLPPYIRRPAEPLDKDRYQTVFARQKGAIAAPTAGLHFQRETLAEIRNRGIEIAYLTLHVGAGTFQPVRSARVEEHRMHREYLEVSDEVCEAVRRTKASGGRVVAVGTTSLRGLESAARNGQLEPYKGDTDLFILPGFSFRVVDVLLTNFHLPGSTLLMLVCAFAGYQAVMDAYRHAVQEKYRFFSYGDAMLLTPSLTTRR